MTRLIPDAERRARLGRRHALVAPVASPEEATAAVAALHSTDPAAMTLSVRARTRAADPSELHRALYEDRSLVRLLTMRRTVFAVAREHAPSFLAATSLSVAAAQRRRTHALLREGGVTSDPEAWLARAETAGRAFLAGDPGVFTTKELAAADPLLATRMRFGAGAQAVEQSVASRLMTLWSSEGVVVRATVAGGWTSTQFRWAAASSWLGEQGEQGEPGGPGEPAVAPDLAEGSALVARLYVARFGPVTPDDLQWWTGWTRTHTRATLAALAAAGETAAVRVTVGGVEVEAVVMADDVAPVDPPSPWVALLPALDPTSMGWKHRDFYLGEHRAHVFDRNGNAGPTVWVDGRVVGGWAIRDDGTVGLDLVEEVDGAASVGIEAQVREVEAFLDGAVVKARARGWTTAETRIRNPA
ncbi:winged helix DNA-binding domain-containing protein [Serinibacter arcticus]|uniref:Winged helix DNA-binding domain-containing protein n=1 Tax=Serinibacter arcticus TaxID=1655435 RepID=A0A4Z1DYJ0_9MICO|nr:winged helix DNA-binding domain-containing protein [Serinibacter arcticus]TGO03898.1 hypothetical protein SERN_2910 [Serinibacter arcticus]